AVVGWKALRVPPLEYDALAEARTLDIGTCYAEHVLGQIDGHDLRDRVLTAQFDWDLRCPGAHVQKHVPGARRKKPEEVRDEDAINLGMVHGVVVAGFLGRVHHLRFKDAGQHRAPPAKFLPLSSRSN